MRGHRPSIDDFSTAARRAQSSPQFALQGNEYADLRQNSGRNEKGAIDTVVVYIASHCGRVALGHAETGCMLGTCSLYIGEAEIAGETVSRAALCCGCGIGTGRAAEV